MTTPPSGPVQVVTGAYAIGVADPDRIALINEATSVQLTFGELRRRANRVSNALRERGIGADDVVVSQQRNGIEHFELLLGTFQIGAVMVPTSTHLTPAEVEYVLHDAGAKAIVATADLAERLAYSNITLPALRFAVPSLAAPGWTSFSELNAFSSDDVPDDRRTGVQMYYTSGTTGKPRGVRRKAAPVSPDLVASGMASFLDVFGTLADPPGTALLFSPSYHAAPGTNTIAALHRGLTVVIQPKFDAEQALAAIEQHRVSVANAVPTHIHRLLQLPERTRSAYDLSSLRGFVVAGAPFSRTLKARALEWLGPRVWEYLGSTEGVAAVVSPQEALEHPGTVGRPADAVILDESGQQVPAGENGTIFFRAPGSEFVYLNDNEKTTKAVRGDGYVTAGDLGYMDEDGYLYLLDRRVDLIITGGVNVYPAEIEQRLAEHEAVRDCAVVGLPDPEWGNIVVAAVELNEDVSPGDTLSEELRSFCRQTLAGPKTPRRFIFRATLPRTETGKMLRREVREQLVLESAHPSEPS
ncbi:AMP-binding protein [Dactylosporangium sp. NPDC005572]|uniref:AMP-binding protein n=1 Tax=Dactylosporangium sp. NPDC005572 TaxID=3156889 RepID=UPI0033A1FDA6